MFSFLGVVVFGAFVLITNVLVEENVPFTSRFHQNDYKVKFEWAEVVRFDKHYVKRFEAYIFKRTRTCTVGNLTFEFNVDFGNELELIIQAYKFTSSNDYRLFPVRFQINFCEGIAANLIGSRSVLACGNFTGCPIRKGRVMRICNWSPDEKKFPPFIPTGRYKLEFQGLYRSKEMFVANGYGEVYRPFVKK